MQNRTGDADGKAELKKSLSRQMTAVFVGLLAFVLAAVFIVNAGSWDITIPRT